LDNSGLVWILRVPDQSQLPPTIFALSGSGQEPVWLEKPLQRHAALWFEPPHRIAGFLDTCHDI